MTCAANVTLMNSLGMISEKIVSIDYFVSFCNADIDIRVVVFSILYCLFIYNSLLMQS